MVLSVWSGVGWYTYLHHGGPEVDCLRTHRAVEEPGEGALGRLGVGGGVGGGGLGSSLGEAHVGLEVLAQGLVEAEADAGGHLGGTLGIVVG